MKFIFSKLKSERKVVVGGGVCIHNSVMLWPALSREQYSMGPYSHYAKVKHSENMATCLLLQ